MSAAPLRARLLRGYGPLLALLIVFALMAAFVPTVGDKVRTVEVAVPVVGGDQPGDSAAPAEDLTGPAGPEQAAAPGTPGPSGGRPAPAGTPARPGRNSATTVTTIAGRAATPQQGRAGTGQAQVCR